MKKLDKSALEKMAKEKNIDKGKIEKMASNYKDKSEDELMSELVKVGKGLEGKEEVVSKFKAFLDEDQQNKLDTIMQKISQAETEPKTKKSKPDRKKLAVALKKHLHKNLPLLQKTLLQNLAQVDLKDYWEK